MKQKFNGFNQDFDFSFYLLSTLVFFCAATGPLSYRTVFIHFIGWY